MPPRSPLPLLQIVALCLGLGAAAARAETLANGIVLPPTWPPEIRHLGREPMDVPYLKQPPAVIGIDVGRQLFVDDFLIDSTNLARVFHQPEIHPASPVLRPDRPWEEKGEKPTDPPHAHPFSDGVWYDDRDGRFKMWYMAGYCQSTAYATSRDGVIWEKPALDVVPGTNIVQPESRDSTTVWLDHAETEPARRFKMMRRSQATRRHLVHFSPDGIHWSEGLLTSRAPDRTTFFHNPFRDVWVMNVRGISIWEPTETAYAGFTPTFRTGSRLGSVRFRRYREGRDLLETVRSWPDSPDLKHLHDPGMWVWADERDEPRADLGVRPEIYHLDAAAYESVMLGVFSLWKGNPKEYPARDKICELHLGFSRDGFHWDRPDRRPFLAVSEDSQAWNYSNLQPAGGGALVVGDRLHFYVSGRMTYDKLKHPGFGSTGLLTLRRDGFASLRAGAEEGYLATRPLQFSGRHLFVNVRNPAGSLQVEAIDENETAIPPFTRENCVVVATDSTRQRIAWRGATDLSALRGTGARFRFHLREGDLYAFWVSPDPDGASHGFLPAGGPGIPGGRDSGRPAPR